MTTYITQRVIPFVRVIPYLLYLAVAIPFFASANTLQVTSIVKGLRIVAIDKLPAAPQDITSESDEYNCERDPPQS